MAYKKLSEATFVENIMDTANVLIEENDEIKRVPKSVMGKVKTVNGAEPDENGNVEIEASGGGAFVVNVSNDDETGDYIADKTYGDIRNAIKNGCVVLLYEIDESNGSIMVYFASYSDNDLIHFSKYNNSEIYYELNADNTVVYYSGR